MHLGSLSPSQSGRESRTRSGGPPCRPGCAMPSPSLPAPISRRCFRRVETPIKGLQIADTCFYYPEDRGIAESVRLGQAMAQAVRDFVEASAPDA